MNTKLEQLAKVWPDLTSQQKYVVYRLAELMVDKNASEFGWEGKCFDSEEDFANQVLDLANEACGDDLIQNIYGPTPKNRTQELRFFARRARIASRFFRGSESGPRSLLVAAREADDVSLGDVPILFAKLQSRQKIRVLRGKFMALRLDAWLNGLGIGPHERHAAIVSAYCAEWDTMSRWVKDVRNVFGDEVDAILSRDRARGEKRLPMSVRCKVDSWQEAIKYEADRYRIATRS